MADRLQRGDAHGYWNWHVQSELGSESALTPYEEFSEPAFGIMLPSLNAEHLVRLRERPGRRARRLRAAAKKLSSVAACDRDRPEVR